LEKGVWRDFISNTWHEEKQVLGLENLGDGTDEQ